MWTALLLLYTLSLTVIYLSYRKAKFVKITDLIKHATLFDLVYRKNEEEGNKQKSLSDVPGPISLPLVGTKWMFYYKYKMSKIHEVYRGELINYIFFYYYLISTDKVPKIIVQGGCTT